MKKILIAACVLLFVSCGKSKKEDIVEEPVVQIYKDNEVIGKWVYESIKINGVMQAYPHNKNCIKDHFYFMNRPGNDHYYNEITYPYPNCAISSTGMDWKLKGADLILNFGKQEFVYKILRLTSTNFDVAINIDFDGDGKNENIELYAVRVECDPNGPGGYNCQVP